MRALLLKWDDWQCLYVDGRAVAQEHRLSVREVMDMAEKYGFVSSQMLERYADKCDNPEHAGQFPDLASSLQGEYK